MPDRLLAGPDAHGLWRPRALHRHLLHHLSRPSTSTGDGARRDEDGYYWITGRVNDVINVSGHRLGTAEIESALVGHEAVAEAAVVGYPHDIRGQGIYCYVTLKVDTQPTDALRADLRGWVRREIGPFAAPDVIQFAPSLPKTRSGKIMRRILRKIAEDDLANLGDTSTLADPTVVDDLVNNRATPRAEEVIVSDGQQLSANQIEAALLPPRRCRRRRRGGLPTRDQRPGGLGLRSHRTGHRRHRRVAGRHQGLDPPRSRAAGGSGGRAVRQGPAQVRKRTTGDSYPAPDRRIGRRRCGRHLEPARPQHSGDDLLETRADALT